MFAHTRNNCDLSPSAKAIEQTGGIQRYPEATRKELLEYYLVALGRASLEMKKRVVQSGLIDRIGKLENPDALKIRDKVIHILKSDSLL